MIRIMHVCSDSIVGGATVTLLRLIEHSDKREFRHIVVLPRSNRLYAEFEKFDIDLIPLHSRPDRSFSLSGVLECLKYIRSLRPDIIHTHGAVFGRIAGYIGGVRSLIYTRHTYKNKKTTFLGRYVNRRLTSVSVAVSPSVIDQIVKSGIDKSNICLIENGCNDMSSVSETERLSDNCRLLYMGRLTEEKGVRVALEAMRMLRADTDRYTLRIVGEGELRDSIDMYIRTNNLSDRVTLTPFQTDVKPTLADTDILLNCSYENEATSLSIIEAFSASVPVCASDILGNSHVVSDTSDGILYKSGDAEELSAAIRKVRKDHNRFALNARGKYLDRFTAARMKNEYEKLWRDEYERIRP